MQGLEPKAAPKRPGGQGELLTRLKREDIYRQRILGTEAGHFIPVDDKRTLSWFSLIIYLIFLMCSILYVWARVDIPLVFNVNSAIKKSVETFSFDTDPVVKKWDDIQSSRDVEKFLLNALPLFLTPEVQEFNYPIAAVQFTLRRMGYTKNENKDFNAFAPEIWKDKNGIYSSHETDKHDNKSSFGVYNVKKNHQLNWKIQPNKRCDPVAEQLDETEQEIEQSLNPDEMSKEVVKQCRAWCEHLMVDSYAKPCRCFSVQGFKCKYFFVNKDDLVADGSSPGVLVPPLSEGVEGVISSANYPLMRTHIFNDSPGFVMNISLPSQEKLIALANASGVKPQAPLMQSEMAYDNVRDLISGGLLGRRSVALAIDIVTYNPNFEVFTWIRLEFRREASGLIKPRLKLTSLVITEKDRSSDQKYWSEFNPVDVLYIIMVIIYVMREFVELGQRGVKYFQFGWNLLTIVTLSLHVATLASRYVYINDSHFTKELRVGNTDAMTTNFRKQADAFDSFLFLSSLNIVFAFFQLVHYLSDTVPKIEVLVGTVKNAMTPVCFLVVIVFDFFGGFVIWSNLMFGKTVYDFSNGNLSLFTCIELIFGQVTAFFNLREYYPFAGGIFFFLYVFIFVIVMQNLSKAVVLTSYDDALDKWNDKRDQKKREAPVRGRLEKGNLPFAESLKRIKGRIRQFLQDKSKHFDKEDVKKKHTQKKAESNRVYNYVFLCGFGVFCAMYIVMTYMQCQINWAFLLTQSVTAAFDSFVFEKTNPISEQVSNNLVLKDVVTQEDATLYLTQVLPMALFNSSQGIFGGKTAEPNPLKLYASALPTKFDQMVINNWNIVVGRTQPVRISLRYALTKAADEGGNLGPDSLVTKDTRIWKTTSVIDDAARTFNPKFEQANDRDQIDNIKARKFVDKYCEYGRAYSAVLPMTKNGWVCMVNREYAVAKKLFEDIELHEVINKQLATFVVDFVIYNAYAEAFTYVALWFQFQPSGEVQQGILTYTIRLELYSGWQALRLLLEISVIILSCFYLTLSFRNMYRDYKAFTLHPEQSGTDMEGKTDQTVPAKLMAALLKLMQAAEAIAMHFVLDPFNLLDLVSSIATLITMVLWYTVVFDQLRTFNFPERPLWQPQFKSGDWDSDDKVIWLFYMAGQKMRWFIRICALNTIMIVLRLLKYLKIFESVMIMFRTIENAFADVLYFILGMAVLLLGFVFSGQLLFGSQTYDFSTIPNSVLACFEMFLGTFDYRSLRESELTYYVIYSVTYVIMFRYMLINMFFAIVDKAFRKEERESERRRDAAAKAEKKRNQDPGEETQAQSIGLVGYVGQMVQGLFKRSQSSVDEPVSPNGESGDVRALEAPSSSSGQSQQMGEPEQTASDDEEMDKDELKKKLVALMKENDTETNWKFLPWDVQDWAIETACPIVKEVNKMVSDKKENEKDQQLSFELETCMTNAQEMLQDKLEKKKEEARETKKTLEDERLGNLKQIHQDQEALAWYIMKREADLKKLESAKKRKHDRYEEVKQAARSLINSGEDEGVKALEDNK